MTNGYIHLNNGTVWPNPDDPEEAEWRMRYSTPTKEDQLYAASVISAYRELCLGRSNAWIASFRRELRASMRIADTKNTSRSVTGEVGTAQQPGRKHHMQVNITRTEATTGGQKRTPREEFVPVFTENDLVEVDMAGDGSESESWTLSWGAPLWPTQIEAMRQLTGAAQDLDSQLKGEQAGGDDDKGGMYTAFFNHGLIKVGVEHQTDSRYVKGRDEDDEGDLNLTNWDRKIKMLADPAMGPLPVGGTKIMDTIRYLDAHYMGEFEHDEDTGLLVPVAARPKRARVVWTDGAMRDFKEFGARLAEDHSDHWPAEDWFVAILGEGSDHDVTLRLYQDIAKNHPNVHVYSFDRVANGAEIAEDMAVTMLARTAA